MESNELNGKKIIALVAEDDLTQRTLLCKLLENRFGYITREAEDGRQVIDMIKSDTEREIDVVIMDLEMPLIDGRVALRHIKKLRPSLPAIVVTAHNDIAQVEECMDAGASDFLTKPIPPDRVHVSIQNALRLSTLNQELEVLKTYQPHSGAFEEMIGHSTGLATTVKLARRSANSDISVLITGESGVGKEVLARAIHLESERADQPFIAVNCGAIPKDLVESILFGHKKGAFTGAIADSLGKFREAEGGTLFLDEVGELAQDAQVRLLRALQQREIEPVGEGHSVPVNVRIIAATNRDMAKEVERGRFREDLFYRLNIFPIHIPPLRERSTDILPLAEFFLERYNASEERDIQGFTHEAEDWMARHHWQGNVRELENALYRAVLLSDGRLITLPLLASETAAPEPEPELPNARLAPLTMEEKLEALTKAISGEVQNERTNASIALTYGNADTTPTFSTEPHLMLKDDDGVFKPFDQLRDEIYNAYIKAYDGHILEASKALHVGKSTLYRHAKGGD